VDFPRGIEPRFKGLQPSASPPGPGKRKYGAVIRRPATCPLAGSRLVDAFGIEPKFRVCRTRTRPLCYAPIMEGFSRVERDSVRLQLTG
jgi:hypothetical protein